MAASLWLALGPRLLRRDLVLGAFALGLAGMLVALSAGFAGLVVLVAYGALALILGRDVPGDGLAAGRLRQLTGVVAAVLFLILAYAAVRADFHPGAYPGGSFGAAAVGRILFARDALAVEAAGALSLVAMVAAATNAAWRRR